jgi:Family of unknown function (DUF6236)
MPMSTFPLHPLIDKRLSGPHVGGPLPFGKRGAVVREDNLDGPPTESAMRAALLFVDQLQVPRGRIYGRRGPDAYGLMEMGLMTRALIDEYETNKGWQEQAFFDVWATHEVQSPGTWTIWERPNDPLIPSRCLQSDLAFRVRIQRALVIPDREVPIESMLLFKERRRAELLALLHHIEGLCITISRGESDARVVRLELERFDSALSQYLRVAHETNWKKAIANMEVSMNWSSIATGAATGLPAAASAFALGLPTSASLMAGLSALATAITVTSTAGVKHQDQSKSPFRYLVQMERELY